MDGFRGAFGVSPGHGQRLVVTLQSDPKVPPGTLSSLARRARIGHRNVRLDGGEALPEPSNLDGVVVLGGTMGAWEEGRFPFLRELKAFCRRALTCGVPLLGICLGAQILAEVLGAAVRRGERGERGGGQLRLTREGLEDPLFWGLPERFAVFHWHDNGFDLPEGAVPLARTDVCPEQAFRFGRCAYGVQFHPEVEESIVEVWGGAPAVAALGATRELRWTAADHLLLNFLGLMRCRSRFPK
jgi:GMP synthase-like glutamine amidotransferase